ncbi:MAG: hypothetical protein HQ481_22005 [Alphaproteobacteria bacterium]|nr:hypothetical protein [Alphaproteobacteria bacterium]
MIQMTTSGWLDRYAAARAASLDAVTNLDRAGQGVADRAVGLGTLLSAIRNVFTIHRSRSTSLIDVNDRVLADLGIARRQVIELAARATEARWSAYDPSLSRIANGNAKYRAA